MSSASRMETLLSESVARIAATAVAGGAVGVAVICAELAETLPVTSIARAAIAARQQSKRLRTRQQRDSP